MANLVVDGSIKSAWCFPDEKTDYTNAVLQAVSDSLAAFAPNLWAYEVRNSVLMGLRRSRISKADAEAFLDSLTDLNIHLVDPIAYDAVYRLAELNGLTMYDAAYLDLALREGSQLASLDEALRRAATKAGVALFEVPRGT
jgi:predicted nucleic acid-binding protein